MAKDKHELESMTKDELINYADDMDAEVQHSWLKEEIVSAILKAQRAAAKQGAAKQPASKEVGMGGEAEAKPVKVTGPINIKGTAYDAGDTVHLTDEELEAVKASGAPIEGVEAQDEEAVQAAHDEGVEAQKQRLEDEKKAQEEKDNKAKAEAKGEEYEESGQRA